MNKASKQTSDGRMKMLAAAGDVAIVATGAGKDSNLTERQAWALLSVPTSKFDHIFPASPFQCVDLIQ